jgi:transcriptional regulator with XRE-family HTH domain
VFRKLRDGHRLTLEQVSEQTGLNKETISRFERGESNPHRRTLNKLAMALGMDADDFCEVVGVRRQEWRPKALGDLNLQEVALILAYRDESDQRRRGTLELLAEPFTKAAEKLRDAENAALPLPQTARAVGTTAPKNGSLEQERRRRRRRA